MGKYIVGITGASGSIYADRLVRRLLEGGHTVLLTITHPGMLVIKQELGLDIAGLAHQDAQNALRLHFAATGESLVYYSVEDIAAPIASGSVNADAMAVLPCSMGTLSALANSASRNLLDRAADVMLKERRRLLVVPREVPFHNIHLQNMLALSQCGALIASASPAFYQNPKDLEELVGNFVDRLLVLLGATKTVAQPWPGM